MERFKWPLATSGMLAGIAAAALIAAGPGASAASDLPTLTMALTGKSVTVGGSMVSGAVNVVTTVTGEQLGSPALFRLNPGEDPSVFDTVTKLVNEHRGDINYADPYGSLVYDANAPKGTSSAETTLQPGTYIALDATSNGVPPHTSFTVTASPTPATLPAPGATIGSIEFGFTGPTTLHDGELVRFVNDGFLVHMDVWVKAKSMAAARLLMKGLLANQSQRKLNKFITAQGEFEGPVSSGGMLQEVITAPPGVYVQACFMDTQDGRSHTQLGMERIFRIVK